MRCGLLFLKKDKGPLTTNNKNKKLDLTHKLE